MGKSKGTLEDRKSLKGYHIRIRVTKDRKSKYYPTGLYLQRKSDFNTKKGRVRLSKFDDAERFNTIIEQEERKQDLICEQEEKTKKSMDLVNSLDIFQDLDRFIHKNDVIKSFDVRNHNKTLKNKLIEFTGRSKDLVVYDITQAFLEDFYLFIRTNARVTTAKHHFLYLKMSIDRIVLANDLTIKNQAKIYRITEKDEPVRKSILNEDTFKIIRESQIRYRKQILVKHSSLFQFFTYGMRISDLTLMKFSKISWGGMDGEDVINEIKALESGKEYFYNFTFTLKYNSYKTNHLHVLELSDQAILELRFFLDLDLQKRFLRGFKDRIVLDPELTKITGCKPSPIVKFIQKSLPFAKTDKDGRFYYLDEGESPQSSFHIYRLKLLLIEQLRRKDRLVFYEGDLALNETDVDTLDRAIFRNTQCQNEALGKICKRLDLKDRLTSHDFRHLFSIITYRKSGNIYLVKELLGHKEIITTVKYLRSLDAFSFNNSKVNHVFDELTDMEQVGDEEVPRR